MDEEMSSLTENDTYSLVELPEDRKAVGSRWVYAIKSGPEGAKRYKARFVARGFTQEHSIDYDETFSPTAQMTSLRTFLQVAANKKLEVHSMDVKTAFLNADIDYEIYVKQPEGYEVTKGDKPLYCKLKKSLYGLKQSSRMWNRNIHLYLMSNGFKQSSVDHCIYTKHDGKDFIMLLLWVDDILIASSSKELLNAFKTLLKAKYKMSDLGVLRWFLGITFEITNEFIKMDQSIYVSKMLNRFGLNDAKPVTSPCDPSFVNNIHVDSDLLEDPREYRELVGSLIYLMIATRPDISYVVTKLSQFMAKPNKNHLSAAKRALRYIKGTSNHGLKFSKVDVPLYLTGFSDSDWGSSEDCKSISGYCFQLQLCGPLISWKSKKQPVVALSSCEAEYVALTFAIQEAKYLKQLLMDLLNIENLPIDVMVDNQSSMKLAKNPVYHQRSKHINIKYLFIRDEVVSGNVRLTYVWSCSNIADIFTKPASSVKLRSFSCIRGEET